MSPEISALHPSWVRSLEGREACRKETDRVAITLNLGGYLEQIVLDDDLALLLEGARLDDHIE